MDYQALIHKLLAVNLHGGMKLGLQNVHHLQRIWHFPDQQFTSIHVAGTNGKGSVCLKIAHALAQAGYRVGLFTSPHLSTFRERIRINGEMISEKAVVSILPGLFQSIDDANLPATFFEITTFLAFLYFAQEKVDIAVLETGLGGRLDATNIVTPCLSIITSISLDHTEILGNTLEEITIEKAGIIKEGVPVIIGPHVPLAPVLAIAEQKKSPCLQVQETSPLFEEENHSLAKAALEHLTPRFNLTAAAIEKGLRASQSCRMEMIEGSPLTILDVAHNPDGIAHLFQALFSRFPGRALRLVFGLSKSKDLNGCLAHVVPHHFPCHIVEATNGRGASKELIKSQLLALKAKPSDLSVHPTIAAGVEAARAEALSQNQIVVIFGTFFIMSEVRQALGFCEPVDSIDMNERGSFATSSKELSTKIQPENNNEKNNGAIS